LGTRTSNNISYKTIAKFLPELFCEENHIVRLSTNLSSLLRRESLTDEIINVKNSAEKDSIT